MDMDDKRFDELIKKYVDSHQKDKDKYLHNAKMPEKKKQASTVQYRKLAYSLCSIIIVMVITLAIFLPVYYYGEKGNPDAGITFPQEHPLPEQPEPEQPLPDISYSDGEDIMPTPTDDPEGIANRLDIVIPEINIEYVVSNTYGLIDKGNADTVIGLSKQYYVFDEVFNTIEINVLPGNIKILNYPGYENLDKSVEHDGIEIQYKEITILEGSYRYNLFYECDGLSYYVVISTFELIDVGENMKIFF